MNRPIVFWSFGIGFIFVALLNSIVLVDLNFEIENYQLNIGAELAKGYLAEVTETIDPATKTRIKEFHFSFVSLDEEVQHEAISYGFNTNLYPGDDVWVEYLSNDPDICRIRSTSHKLHTRPGDLGIFLGIVGLIFIIVAIAVGAANRQKIQLFEPDNL